MNHHDSRIAISVAEFAELIGIGRTKVFEEIKTGRLITRKCGRRRLIPMEEVRSWLERLGSQEGEALNA